MEFNKEVSNPLLVGAMMLIKAEDTPDHRKLFMNELAKAKLLAPVAIDPPPTFDAEGNTIEEKDEKVMVPQLNAPDGKRFFALYTDKACMKAATDAEGVSTPEMFRDNYAVVTLDEIGGMMTTPMINGEMNPVEGVVLNPFNENVVVGKEAAIGLFMNKVNKIREMAEKNQPREDR